MLVMPFAFQSLLDLHRKLRNPFDAKDCASRFPEHFVRDLLKEECENIFADIYKDVLLSTGPTTESVSLTALAERALSAAEEALERALAGDSCCSNQQAILAEQALADAKQLWRAKYMEVQTAMQQLVDWGLGSLIGTHKQDGPLLFAKVSLRELEVQDPAAYATTKSKLHYLRVSTECYLLHFDKQPAYNKQLNAVITSNRVL